MQMGNSAFVKFQHADEGNRLPELPRQRHAHFAPALPDVAICTLTLRNPLRVEGECRHALQFVLCGDLRDACAHFFEFWVAAPATAVRLAEKRRMAEFSRLAFHWP